MSHAAANDDTAPDWLVDDSLAPNPDGALAALYEAGARGELALPHCNGCGQPLELEQARCDLCGSVEVVWCVVEPAGTVHSVTTVHRHERGLILTTEPYHVIDVELASGHRLLMTTERQVATAPAIGDPARVTFRHVRGVAIPSLAAPANNRANKQAEVPQ